MTNLDIVTRRMLKLMTDSGLDQEQCIEVVRELAVFYDADPARMVMEPAKVWQLLEQENPELAQLLHMAEPEGTA